MKLQEIRRSLNNLKLFRLFNEKEEEEEKVQLEHFEQLEQLEDVQSVQSVQSDPNNLEQLKDVRISITIDSVLYICSLINGGGFQTIISIIAKHNIALTQIELPPRVVNQPQMSRSEIDAAYAASILSGLVEGIAVPNQYNALPIVATTSYDDLFGPAGIEAQLNHGNDLDEGFKRFGLNRENMVETNQENSMSSPPLSNRIKFEMSSRESFQKSLHIYIQEYQEKFNLTGQFIVGMTNLLAEPMTSDVVDRLLDILPKPLIRPVVRKLKLNDELVNQMHDFQSNLSSKALEKNKLEISKSYLKAQYNNLGADSISLFNNAVQSTFCEWIEQEKAAFAINEVLFKIGYSLYYDKFLLDLDSDVEVERTEAYCLEKQQLLNSCKWKRNSSQLILSERWSQWSKRKRKLKGIMREALKVIRKD